MGSIVGISGILLILLVASGLGTAIGLILKTKAVWIPSMVVLALSLVASAALLILIGKM